jgi:hypothetical protein
MPLQVLAVDPGTNPNACGITKLKAQAIQYIAQTAGNSAGTLGGEIGGSFGGINVGLGILGKLSIRDNKTIHSLVTTALQRTATRAGEEASYRVLDMIPDKQFNTLADWIQAYLNAQLNPPSGS